jgi:two-component system, sensor histidine kinase
MEIVNPNYSLLRKNEKLQIIVSALMQRAEQSSEQSGYAYAQFERAALLEAQVRERTADQDRVLELLNESSQRLVEANEATKRAWSNLKEATETIPDGLALFDADDRLVLFNRQFCCELIDVVDDLRTGMTFDEYLEIASNSKYLDISTLGTAGNWVEWRKALHGEKRVLFNVAVVSGNILQIQSRRTSSGSTVVLHSDVTDTVRLERDRLIDQQIIQLRATLDHLDQGVCIFNRTGKLVGWNSRLDTLLALPKSHKSQGLSVARLIDRLSGQIDVTGAFSLTSLQEWVGLKTGRQPIEFEVKRGEKTILSVFGQEMPDQGFLLSFSDVTAERAAGSTLTQMNEALERRVKERTVELDQALAEAKRANASKSRFVAAASHDLAQPMSAAKLYIASLADGDNSQHVVEVAKKAETALQSAEQIIEALLDISRFDSQRATVDRQPVPLDSVLKALENEFIQSARAKGLKFAVVGSSLVVNSDPGLLRRIIQNFISNAVRYTDHGKILVGVRRVGSVARVEVRDTGRGISRDEQKIIFEEFKQLDHSLREVEGLGLGLAIVERASQALGHPLNLWSEPGIGSCFSIDMQIVGKSLFRPDIGAVPSERQATDAITSVVVLLAVTDLQLSRALSNLIEGWGGVALEVTSQSEALSLLADVDLVPDVLLLDGHMKDGMTGVDAYDAITELLGVLPTRIITADRSEKLRQLCRERQLEIMHKPIDPTALSRFLTSVEAD